MSFIFQDNECDTKAEIVGFSFNKCAGCWGWEVKINDTIFIAPKLPNININNYDTMKLPKSILIGYRRLNYMNNIHITCLKIID